MVRVVRLERTVSWSQTRRDTNFAIPGYSLFCHDTTASGKNKAFSVCGHSCGQNRFCVASSNREKSRKRRRRKALRRFALPCPGYRHGTPKPPALPTALHPVMKFPPLETTHASDLTFILYINTAQSAIFFSARLPRQSYYCAEGSDAANAASEPSAEAAPYKSKPSFFSLFRTADVLRLISAAISLIGTALLHMSAARSSCS